MKPNKVQDVIRDSENLFKKPLKTTTRYILFVFRINEQRTRCHQAAYFSQKPATAAFDLVSGDPKINHKNGSLLYLPLTW